MNSAARTIQKGWRRTAVRIGRLGQGANVNRINYSIMNGVPIKRLHQTLLRIAQKHGQEWKYVLNNNGHMMYYGSNIPWRMNRRNVIHNIAMLTNIRPNRNRAARMIQAHARGARARREAAFRRTPFAKSLPRNILNKIF